MGKTIKLSEDQAKALYEKDNELRDTLLHGFSDEELGIKAKPFTWYDLREIGGFFIYDIDSNISKPAITGSGCNGNRNVAPTKKDAKSSRAKNMLLQLAKHYNDGETEEEWIDWGDKKQQKHYLLCNHYSHFAKEYLPQVTMCYQMSSVFFKRREDLNKCFADNRELWDEYFKR